MADITQVSIGAAPDDGTGDPARTAFSKINANEAALNAELATKANGVHTHVPAAIQVSTGPRLLGSDVAGNAKEISLGTNLSMSGTTLNASAGEGGAGDWGSIGGTLSDQTDLQAELDGKADVSHSHPLADLSDFQMEALSNIGNNELIGFSVSPGKFVNLTREEAGLASAAQGLLADSALQPEDISTVEIIPRFDAIDFSTKAPGYVLTEMPDGTAEFAEVGSHTHTKSDITDFTIQTADIGADQVGPDQLAHTAVTPGSYTNADITVDQQGRITAASSGAASGGLATAVDSGTALTVGAAPGTHKILDAASTITLTLSGTAAIGTRQAFTKGGAGAVNVAMGAGAGYWLKGDNVTGAPRTAGFAISGHGYFEVFRNVGGSAAEWVFLGDSDHASVLNGTLDGGGNLLFGARVGVESASGALGLTHLGKRLLSSGPFTVPTTPTGWWAVMELGGDHDITFNSQTLDVSLQGWGTGDILGITVLSGSTLDITRTAAADKRTEADFAP